MSPNPGLGLTSTRNIPLANLAVGVFEGNLGTPPGLPGIFSRRTDGDIEGGCSAHKSTQRGILVTENTEY